MFTLNCINYRAEKKTKIYIFAYLYIVKAFLLPKY